jgi:hypothetical protein
LGSSLPLDANDPLKPMNRRISLVVLNDKTERQIRGMPEEPVEEIQNEDDAASVLGVAPDGSPAEAEPTPVESAPDEPAPPQPEGDRLAQPAARQPPA